MPQAERIDRYEILRKIATGGMAELFLAKQTGLEGFEKAVVIKRILAHLAQDQEFVSMFLDEARIAAKLSHPNIVQIYDLGRADDTYYIAMEYVSGRNMAAVLRKARDTGIGLPIEHTAKVVAGVCDGLYYAHTRKDYDGTPLNIIHRDISPQNILVAFSGNVKLVDFGIAKASTQIAQTRAGVLKGKYAYMSPEQVRGDKIDSRSDIFAVGIVMYEFLTGQRPFERETSLKTLKAIVQEKPLNPRELNPEVPIEVVRILSRALEKNPDRRYPNGQEMQLAIEDYLDRAPRKSNNVRLSRYLYELFDDELNADGGTMIVKGIGELIVPTGASSEAIAAPKVDELPEGTVRAALQEIAAARAERDKDSVSIVTDEKVAESPAVPLPARSEPEEEPEARTEAGASQEIEEEDEEFPDTVMQAAPERPEEDEPAPSPAIEAPAGEAEFDYGDDPQPTIELARADFSAEAINTSADPGEDQEELDGATLPAYDPAKFGLDRGNGDADAQEEADAEQAAQPFPPEDEDEGIPHPDEAETASLSPDQVRRILDRVESLRQQATGSEGSEGTVEAKAPRPKSSETAAPRKNDYESEDTIGFEEEEALDYGSDLGDATRAQPEPQFSNDGGNGHSADDALLTGMVTTDPDQRSDDEIVAPDLGVLGMDDGDDDGPSIDMPRATAPAMPEHNVQGSGGIRIVRRKASDAELRERAAFESGAVAAPAGGVTPRPARQPLAMPIEETSQPDLEQTPPPPLQDLHRPGNELSMTAPARDVIEVSQVTAHSATNARLLLLLAVLAAVAAGLGLLYVLLFASPAPAGDGTQPGESGTVYLKTDPPGATIILDTRPHPTRTPTTIGGLTFNQQHIVMFKLEGYDDGEDRFTLTPAQKIKPISVQLKKKSKK
ncbi:MAG: protein kinase [Pseudomonadota bacterium]